MSNDTTYVQKGGIEEIFLPESFLTSYNVHGFEVNYIKGKPVLTKNGLLYLWFIRQRFMETEKEFKRLCDGNNFSNVRYIGMTEQDKDKAETNNSYARVVYEALGGEEFLNKNKDSGLLVGLSYKFELRKKEELDRFRSMGLELKLVGKSGTLPIIEIADKDIERLRFIKFDVAKSAKNIMDLSKWILEHYEDVLLKERIKNGHKKAIGGS